MNCLINLGSTSAVVPKITSVYFKSEYRADLSLSDILLKKRGVFVYIQAVRYIKRTAMLVYGAFPIWISMRNNDAKENDKNSRHEQYNW